MNVNDYFKYKKRVVVKIGSSSLQHPQTGSMNLMKIEKLVRELCDLRNQGMDVCLVSSGAIAVGRQAIGLQNRPEDISTKQACRSCWTGPANDDISADVCGVQSDSRTDSYDKGYNVRGRILSECAKYV